MLFFFWGAVCIIFYIYIGYPLHMGILSKCFPLPVNKCKIQNVEFTVSIVISAKNEEKNIEKRILNLIAQDYPSKLYEIIIVSDGSVDNTCSVVKRVISKYPDKCFKLIELLDSSGKPSALNVGVQNASGEFVLFTDVRQVFKPDVFRQLLANFADPAVGCVSGELRFLQNNNSNIKAPMGAYWKYEKYIRKVESVSGSVVGATGAIYAIRRELYLPLPSETLVDDVMTPLNIAQRNKRVVFDANAIAYDVVSENVTAEWKRKVRTLTGNWQLFSLRPDFFNPFQNPMFFRFIGHKVLRLFVPLLLLILLISSASLTVWYSQLFLCVQLVFYGFVLLAHFWPQLRNHSIVKFAYFFVTLNVAVVYGFFKWLFRQSHTTWNR